MSMVFSKEDMPGTLYSQKDSAGLGLTRESSGSMNKILYSPGMACPKRLLPSRLTRSNGSSRMTCAGHVLDSVTRLEASWSRSSFFLGIGPPRLPNTTWVLAADRRRIER